MAEIWLPNATRNHSVPLESVVPVQTARQAAPALPFEQKAMSPALAVNKANWFTVLGVRLMMFSNTVLSVAGLISRSVAAELAMVFGR